MECKTLEGVDSLVHISRGVLIELSFRWIPSCLAWCPLIREIAGIWARWSSTISLRFYCALLVHFALQWLPMMASPIAPLLFNITSDMTSSQATYIVKAAAPVQKSWKGNTVKAQLNNQLARSDLKKQHRDAQVAHKCVSPPHDSKWRDCRRSRVLLSRFQANIASQLCPAHYQDSGFLFT
jgi:hypothetical protein